jgi:hypothetical protein
MERKIYQIIAASFDAMLRCQKRTGCSEWESEHSDRIEWLAKNCLPSGSGFDCGTKFDFRASKENKLVFTTEFHHMNSCGYYTGWTSHNVTIVPSLSGEFNLKVSGRDRDDIKNYIAEAFDFILRTELNESEEAELMSIRPNYKES